MGCPWTWLPEKEGVAWNWEFQWIVTIDYPQISWNKDQLLAANCPSYTMWLPLPWKLGWFISHPTKLYLYRKASSTVMLIPPDKHIMKIALGVISTSGDVSAIEMEGFHTLDTYLGCSPQPEPCQADSSSWTKSGSQVNVFPKQEVLVGDRWRFKKPRGDPLWNMGLSKRRSVFVCMYVCMYVW